MNFTRRELLGGVGGVAASAVLQPLSSGVRAFVPGSSSSGAASATTGLPRKDDFAIPQGLTYINGAYTHPMPLVALEAIKQNAESRARPDGVDRGAELTRRVKEEFAALINARPSE